MKSATAPGHCGGSNAAAGRSPVPAAAPQRGPTALRFCRYAGAIDALRLGRARGVGRGRGHVPPWRGVAAGGSPRAGGLEPAGWEQLTGAGFAGAGLNGTGLTGTGSPPARIRGLCCNRTSRHDRTQSDPPAHRRPSGPARFAEGVSLTTTPKSSVWKKSTASWKTPTFGTIPPAPKRLAASVPCWIRPSTASAT